MEWGGLDGPNGELSDLAVAPYTTYPTRWIYGIVCGNDCTKTSLGVGMGVGVVTIVDPAL